MLDESQTEVREVADLFKKYCFQSARFKTVNSNESELVAANFFNMGGLVDEI